MKGVPKIAQLAATTMFGTSSNLSLVHGEAPTRSWRRLSPVSHALPLFSLKLMRMKADEHDRYQSGADLRPAAATSMTCRTRLFGDSGKAAGALARYPRISPWSNAVNRPRDC